MKTNCYALTFSGFVLVMIVVLPGLALAGPKGLDRDRTGDRFRLLCQVKNNGSSGYDPTKDPGSSGPGKTVDYEKIQSLIEKFDSGIGQKGKSQKSAETPPPAPIPKDYTSPGEPAASKESPQDMGGTPPSIPGSSNSSSPIKPESEKAILQQYSK